MKFYSKSTGAFFAEEINGENMPVDAMPITDERHAELMAGQSEGKKIIADEHGAPTLAERPGPTSEEVLAQRQAEARAYLNSTDWYVSRKLETGKDIPDDVVALRTEARIVADQTTAG